MGLTQQAEQLTTSLAKSKHATCRKKMNHSEIESRNPVEFGLPDDPLFMIRLNQEQLVVDQLSYSQNSQTVKPETKHPHSHGRAKDRQASKSYTENLPPVTAALRREHTGVLAIVETAHEEGLKNSKPQTRDRAYWIRRSGSRHQRESNRHNRRRRSHRRHSFKPARKLQTRTHRSSATTQSPDLRARTDRRHLSPRLSQVRSSLPCETPSKRKKESPDSSPRRRPLRSWRRETSTNTTRQQHRKLQ
ncbi:BnaA05g28110D [Brassica napus]|uniref:Uncharacterized protein n=2 Tax=Brassica TaxID=3705 RepID=M4F0Q7_BRACM|nr:unnamed protein product [Brassica napus]CDY08575.1 BnaA05g28110D [Brassica napus]